jgi:DNA-binding transcriptional ArsR family regulator
MVTGEVRRVELVTLYTRVMLYLAQNPKISQEMLARHLEVTMRTVQRHLSELEEEGYIRVDRRKKPFAYDIEWSKSCPNIPWLKLVFFRPGVNDSFHDISDAGVSAYQRASGEERDASTGPNRALETAAAGSTVA